MLREWQLLAWLGLALACGPAPVVVHVTFPGEVDVGPGSPVVYQGVAVGEVSGVALRQDDPSRRAQVAVTLEIDSADLVLREDDRITVGSLLGVPVIEILPAPEESRPLASGAVVAGEPPLVTKVYESLGAAVESIGEIAVEAIEEALEDIEQKASQVAPSPEAPAP
jgi:ABC-type transporter Mla subunit MlaD